MSSNRINHTKIHQLVIDGHLTPREGATILATDDVFQHLAFWYPWAWATATVLGGAFVVTLFALVFR